MSRISILAILFAALCSTAFADVVIDDYSHETNDRFTNSSEFIANHLDLSGLGQNTTGRWSTVISRNVILSAVHFQPNGTTVNFYEGNDPTSSPITRTVTGGTRIGSTDIWLGVLDSNLPSTITAYDIANEMLSGTPNPNAEGPYDDAGVYQDLNAWVVGRSPFDHNSDANRELFNDQALGRNRITGYAENVDFQARTDNDTLIMWHDDPADSDYVEYEAQYRGGDSGGPLFAEVNGELRVIGVNSFLLQDSDGNFVANGATYLGNQYDAINDFIELNAVPEPSSGLAITALIGVFLTRRRRV